MKREPFLTGLTGSALAFLISWSSLGCLISAFDLTLQAPERLAAFCALAAGLSALLLSIRFGSTLLVCLMALAAGYLYQRGLALDQFRNLVATLCSVYNRAYGWGMPLLPDLPAEAAFADWPLIILGSLICICVCESVCRQRPATLSVLMTLLPLGACVVVTDTVPAEPWLLAVMTGLILLVLASPVRRENPKQGAWLTIAAALPVLLALMALFQAAPREGYVNQTRGWRNSIRQQLGVLPASVEEQVENLVTSIPAKPAKQLNLSTLGRRKVQSTPVLEVTAEQSGVLYLREQDYDRYSGLVWTASDHRRETFSHSDGSAEFITIHPLRTRELMLLPYHPEEAPVLSGGGLAAREDGEYTLLRRQLPADWRQTAYQSASRDDRPDPAYLSLPEATRQEAQALLAGVLTPDASNTEKADIIAALVTNSAVYDLDPSRMPQGEPDFALWFLREGERGYCVHFATAATVLLRAANVPARYVTGYMLDAVSGQTVAVTEEDAHAWAEYYEPNLGVWLPLEATPTDQSPDTAPMSPVTEPPPTESAPATEEPVTRPTEIHNEPATEEVLPPVLPGEPVPENPVRWPLLLLLPLLLAAQRWIRLTWRSRRCRKGSPNHQALRHWQEAERLCRILKEVPPAALQELALKAKFSQYTLTDEELAQFDSHNQSCIRRMQKQPRWRQLLYRFVYAAY